MFGLTLLDTARPIHPAKLASLQTSRQYVELMTTWGPGRLCGVFELPDPSEPDGRFAYFQHQLRIHAIGLRNRGHWAQLADDELARMIVLGVDRRGCALATRGADEVLLLRPRGVLVAYSSLEAVVRDYVLGGGLLDDYEQRYEAWRDLDLGIPASYATDPDAARHALFDAIAASDEAAADAALERVLATEVTLVALLEIAELLASETELPRDLRAGYVDQCLRMAKRRATKVVGDAPIRELREAIAKDGALSTELAARIAILDRPAGIFIAHQDPREAALLAALAAHPDDLATRLVYADHLEESGDLARAEIVRAGTSDVLPDAKQRGFLAPPGMAPVDGAALLRTYLDRWRIDDPETSIEELVARVEALHPVARQGYAILLAQVRPMLALEYPNEAEAALLREIADAWPLLALSLRAYNRRALALLVAAKQRDAAPFILSVLRHPPPLDIPNSWWSGTFKDWLADAYVQLATPDAALVDECLATLATGEPSQYDIPFRLLVHSANDDRVFDAYLRHFAAAHPLSETAIAARRHEPRVIEVLSAGLTTEEKRSLVDGKHVAYTKAYGILAQYLAELGNAAGKEAHARYKKFRRWMDRPERDNV